MKRSEKPTLTEPTAKHAGEVLLNKYMKPLGLPANRLALALHVTPQRIYEIINGRRGITAETALRLSRLLRTTARSWLDLQLDYELQQAQEKWSRIIDQEIQPVNIMSPAVDSRTKAEQQIKQKQESSSTSAKLTRSQKKIYNLLSEDFTHFDVLLNNSGMSTPELLSTLTMLELSMMVQCHPGNRYSKLVTNNKKHTAGI